VAYGQSLEEGLVTLKPETKFYQEVKQNFKNFHLTRIENISIPGVPDLLCYKLSLSLLEARNFVNRYLMKLNFTKDLASCSLPPVACRLTLVARGLTPVACCLKSLVLEACRLPPGARNFYNL
jgi:hypothetical protein